MKPQAFAWHDGLLFSVNGQGSNSRVNLDPDPVLDAVWITELT